MVDERIRGKDAATPSTEETRRILAGLVGQLSILLDQVRIQVGYLPGEDENV